MAPNDQPFTPLDAESGLASDLYNYCSPIDLVANGALDDQCIERIQHNLRGYLVEDARYQLPPDLSSFSGRRFELETVTTELRSVSQSDQDSSPKKILINGRAGIGKSALAIHAAHQLKPFFPDAQLYVNLCGSESNPLSPRVAIANLLQAWNQGDEWLPESLDKRRELYQATLENKRALIVLDDAIDATQVRPLIPHGSQCGILITSRTPLNNFSVKAQLSLTEMNEEDSLNLLLKSLAGNQEISVDTQVAQELVNLCYGNPLAIEIVARTLQGVSTQQLLDYNANLVMEQNRLAVFNNQDLILRACFSLAYQELNESCAKLFRRLSLLTQPSLTVTTAKTLLSTDEKTAKATITDLVRRRLLRPIAKNHYQFQPLLRLIAKEKLAQTESSQQRRSLRLEITQWYLRTAEAMALGVHPAARSQATQRISEQAPGLLPAREKTLRLTALNWFEKERSNLMTCINWADEAKAWDMVVQFAKHLVIFFSIGGYWQDWERSHQLALEASRRLNNQQLEAQILNNLGNLFLRQGYLSKARKYYDASLSLLDVIEDLNGRALASLNLTALYNLQQEEHTARGLPEISDTTRFENTSVAPAAHPQQPPQEEDSVRGLRDEVLDTTQYSQPSISPPAAPPQQSPFELRHSPPAELKSSKNSSTLSNRRAYVVISSVTAATLIFLVILILIQS